jgi:hypothetical protein
MRRAREQNMIRIMRHSRAGYVVRSLQRLLADHTYATRGRTVLDFLSPQQALLHCEPTSRNFFCSRHGFFIFS